MSTTLTSFVRKAKCPDDSCVMGETRTSKKGDDYIVCSQCDNFMQFVCSVDRATCKHANVELRVAGDSSKRPGSQYRFCLDCKSFQGYLRDLAAPAEVQGGETMATLALKIDALAVQVAMIRQLLQATPIVNDGNPLKRPRSE